MTKIDEAGLKKILANVRVASWDQSIGMDGATAIMADPDFRTAFLAHIRSIETEMRQLMDDYDTVRQERDEMRSIADTDSYPEKLQTIEAITQGFWLDLEEKDDRTSPEEYPDMCLITHDELEKMLLYIAGISKQSKFDRNAVIEECAKVNEDSANCIEAASSFMRAATCQRGKEVAEILRSAATSIRDLRSTTAEGDK